MIQVSVSLIYVETKLDAFSDRYAIFNKLSAQSNNIVVLLVRHRIVHKVHLDRNLVTIVLCS
jgi:hypothetical protein